MKNYNRIILYNDEDLMYLTGDLSDYYINQNYQIGRSITGKSFPILLPKKFTGTISDYKETETIQLDETLMKRIAKYNKEAEIKKYDKIIEEKKKKIKELDDILQDKSKRVEKIKKFIANIYDLELEEDNEDNYFDD